MEIIKVIPRGFCKGVVNAIKIAKQTAEKYPNEKIYILGMLVHNKYVIEALALHGIQTIEDKQKTRLELLDEIESGVVIFTAHGVHDFVKEKAKQKGLICIDASCQDVLVTHALIQEKRKEGYEVLYVGKKNHPEASAVCDDYEHVHLIENCEDVQMLVSYEKVFVTNQTTMSAYDVKQIFTCIQKKYPHAIISDEICNATRSRQEAIYQLQDIDCCIIVGDKNSNNANRLAHIAKQQNIIDVYLIDDVNDLDIHKISSYKRVAISAGASTPTYLINQVIHCLENGVCETQKIDLDKIL